MGSSMHVAINPLPGPVGDLVELEIVERKGIGHPDTICDEIAENFSLALSRYYLAEFGEVLHHNVDKVLLAAGVSQPQFRGGRIVAPIRLFLAGRATQSVDSRTVPIDELARKTALDWFALHLPIVDLERDVEVHSLVHSGSANLGQLFARRSGGQKRLANDTSCGVGYAPLSRLEEIVDAVERELGAMSTDGRGRAIGRDVKVMGLRTGQRIDLTVACAMIGKAVRDVSEYLRLKEEIAQVARQIASSRGATDATVEVNVADDPAEGSFFLTVAGTSAEAGDDGEAGRGNRVNGLIAPHRPMTMESVASKNPITHVGKLYNIVASLMAEDIVRQLREISAAEVHLVSRIGHPLDEPALVDVRVAARSGEPAAFAKDIETIVRRQLSRIETLWQELVRGELRIGRWPLRAVEALQSRSYAQGRDRGSPPKA